jgi:hypothetical protein
MSEQKSSILPRILIGVAIGAAAFVLYNRRGIFAGVSGPQPGAQLPPGSVGDTVVNADGTPAPRAETFQFDPSGTTTSTAGTSVTAASSTAVQKAQGTFAHLLAPVQRYIASARAQLDVAIAEGQAQAARTRQDLEVRFEEAKKDPQRGRSAFM